MGQSMFYVKLINKGRTMQVTVPAYTQKEARDLAEYQYPGYKAMSAQRIS
jgi:hypothetical protein